MSDDDVLIKVEGVSKKFCRSLKRSMVYGMQDIARDALGLPVKSAELRPEEFWAVEDVSFEVKRGECLGIIGPNGAGKSTLLKMLNGIMPPDKGKITVRGRMGALIELGAGFHPMLTGRENIYLNGVILGLSKREIDKKFDEIVAFAELEGFIDTPVKNYSSGMYMRLGFSIAAYLNSNVLLIDEVLAVGDIGFRAKCLLKCEDVLNNGNSIILVSHNMNDINRIASLAVLVEYGKAKNFESTSLAIATFQSLFLSKKERFSDDDFYLIEVFANCNPTQTYQTLKIFLRFNLSVFFTNIWLGFSITSINQTILFADTIIINQCEPGFHQFELVFDRLLLLQGSYSFGIFVWANNRTKHLFEDRNILELIIIDDKLDTRKTDGFVCLPYRYNHLLEEMQIC